MELCPELRAVYCLISGLVCELVSGGCGCLNPPCHWVRLEDC